MRIYDLQNNLDALLRNDKFQIEIIGEDGGWTGNVNRRVWNGGSQRWEYSFEAGITSESFLSVYDFIVRAIADYSPPIDDTPPLVRFLTNPDAV